jgi:hypothetical protein
MIKVMTQPPSQPSPHIDAATSALGSRASKQAIEAELTRLQNANRLGIHIWEKTDYLSFPNAVRSILHADIDHMNLAFKRHCDASPIQMFSSSLVPSCNSTATIRPFGCTSYYAANFGYLIDLNDTIIFRAHERGLYSGGNPSAKSLQLPVRSSKQNRSHIDSLNNVYQEFSTQEWLEHLARNDWHEISNNQLDILGNYYERSKEEGRRALPYNEIIMAAAEPSIKAIVLPYYEHYEANNSPALAILSDFSAAVAGLQHLARDIDLPVVRYHVDGAKRGQCGVIAQGKEELLALLKSSRQQIIDNPQLRFADYFGSGPLMLAEDNITHKLCQIADAAKAPFEEKGLARD